MDKRTKQSLVVVTLLIIIVVLLAYENLQLRIAQKVFQNSRNINNIVNFLNQQQAQTQPAPQVSEPQVND